MRAWRNVARLVLSIAVLSGAIEVGYAQQGPVTTVSAGRVEGVALAAGGAVFKGIPFAAPPVGNLRWREPQPVRPWTDTRRAAAFGSRCIQSGAEPGAEDCLYLNVWTPEWPVRSRLPVMLWIHGGGNFAGAGSEPTFDGERLARRGVVLVTANYRLGVFGFFAHPELAAESPHHTSGNYGLLDQIAAMQWVRDNIARFGGDPDNVTVFGESAGSLDINMLMASPRTRGLFRRVIGESGPILKAPSRADGESKGVKVAASLLKGASGSVLSPLRAISAADLQQATGQGLGFLGPELGITIDGWVFDRPPVDVFADGKQHKVDLLLGSNARELSRPFFPMSGGLAKGLEDFFGPLATRALTVYGVANGAVPTPHPLHGDAMAQFATDTQFRCGTVMELGWHTAAGNTAYQFEFARVARGREAAGAAHGSEVPYVFGTLGSAFDAVDRQVSDAMQIYWTTFARTGNPTAPSLTSWPKYDARTRPYIEFTDGGPVARTELRRAACDLYVDNMMRLMGRTASSH